VAVVGQNPEPMTASKIPRKQAVSREKNVPRSALNAVDRQAANGLEAVALKALLNTSFVNRSAVTIRRTIRLKKLVLKAKKSLSFSTMNIPSTQSNRDRYLRMFAMMVAAAVALMPFNDLPWFRGLFREMGYEGAFYPFLALNI
jgi:hypothetical protein